MYVLIANGYSGVIESKETLDVLASIFPYPKFRKVVDKEAAFAFLEKYRRGDYAPVYNNYGDTDAYYGYAKVTYIIDKNDLYVTVDTSKLGNVKLPPPKDRNIVIDNSTQMIRIKIRDINLNDDKISDHCYAIYTILNLIGEFVDVNIEVPDISVYLALFKYKGEYYSITAAQEEIHNRLGAVAVTIK